MLLSVLWHFDFSLVKPFLMDGFVGCLSNICHISNDCWVWRQRSVCPPSRRWELGSVFAILVLGTVNHTPLVQQATQTCATLPFSLNNTHKHTNTMNNVGHTTYTRQKTHNPFYLHPYMQKTQVHRHHPWLWEMFHWCWSGVYRKRTQPVKWFYLLSQY